MTAEEIRTGTQRAWDRFYSLGKVWRRSRCVRSIRYRLAFMLVSKLYRQMYGNTGIATDSARVSRSAAWARWRSTKCGTTATCSSAAPTPPSAATASSTALATRGAAACASRSDLAWSVSCRSWRGPAPGDQRAAIPTPADGPPSPWRRRVRARAPRPSCRTRSPRRSARRWRYPTGH